MTRSEALWITSEEARKWLDSAMRDEIATPSVLNMLRKNLPAESARLVVQQVELRQRAGAKFPLAERMFFTRVGLEQATDACIAGYKARRFVGCDSVADLCCGVGGDLVALAEDRAATGVDRCFTMAALAAANAEACGLDRVTTSVGDAEETHLGDFDAWHVDPDRRAEGRRTTSLATGSPSEASLDRMRQANPNAAMKLAPATTLPESWHAEAEVEWISRGGECKQQVAWFGSLAKQPGQRRATRVDESGRADSFLGRPNVSVENTNAVRDSIYEADSAVYAAGLDTTMAAELGIDRLCRDAGYYTGPVGRATSLMREFHVRDVVPFRLKTLRDRLRSVGVGSIELKQRGVKHNLQKLRSQLKLEGDEQVVVILTRIGIKQIAIIARRAHPEI